MNVILNKVLFFYLNPTKDRTVDAGPSICCDIHALFIPTICPNQLLETLLPLIDVEFNLLKKNKKKTQYLGEKVAHRVAHVFFLSPHTACLTNYVQAGTNFITQR